MIPNYFLFVYLQCARVQEETFSVPVHAYPSVPAAKLPRHIDFGNVPAGQTRTHTITLASPIPVPFDFTLINLQPEADFQVSCAAGTIPANGSIDVTVTFQPTTLSSHVTQLQLQVDHFHSDPICCDVSGYAQSGTARKSELQKLLGSAPEDMATLDSVVLLTEAMRAALTESTGVLGKRASFGDGKWKVPRKSLAPIEVRDIDRCALAHADTYRTECEGVRSTATGISDLVKN